MLLWLMNIDFAGGDGAVEEVTPEYKGFIGTNVARIGKLG